MAPFGIPYCLKFQRIVYSRCEYYEILSQSLDKVCPRLGSETDRHLDKHVKYESKLPCMTREEVKRQSPLLRALGSFWRIRFLSCLAGVS